jgi:hypothetical protein
MRVRSDQIGPDRLRRLLDAANEVIVLYIAWPGAAAAECAAWLRERLR